MKTRYVWLMFGLAFFVTLAVIVGQRLSAEAMAVMVGVVAGVAASIPTSLIVVWFATRTTLSRHVSEAPRPSEPPEPRIVVLAQPTPTSPTGYQNFAGYPPAAYPAYPVQPALPPRQFTVIGGAQVALEQPAPQEEALWPR
jgi:hypothetical protein